MGVLYGGETAFKSEMLRHLEPVIRPNPKINPYYITVKPGPPVSVSFLYDSAQGERR